MKLTLQQQLEVLELEKKNLLAKLKILKREYQILKIQWESLKNLQGLTRKSQETPTPSRIKVPSRDEIQNQLVYHLISLQFLPDCTAEESRNISSFIDRLHGNPDKEFKSYLMTNSFFEAIARSTRPEKQEFLEKVSIFLSH